MNYFSGVTPWTADQARRWRAAVLPLWMDPRWSGLGWLAGVILLVAFEGQPAYCGEGTDRPCIPPWIDDAIGSVVLVQVVVVFTMPALGVVTRRLVLALMTAPAPFTFYIEHVWLRRLYYVSAAWTWLMMALDQWARRRQLRALPVGDKAPALPSRESVPAGSVKHIQLVGGLLAMALGLSLLGVGVGRQLAEDRHWRDSVRTAATFETLDKEHYRIRVRLDTDNSFRWVPTDDPDYYLSNYRFGDPIAVLVDGSWTRFPDEPYGAFGWPTSGYLCLLLGALAAGSALRRQRNMRRLWRKPPRALKVWFVAPGKADTLNDMALIYPADGTSGTPLLAIPVLGDWAPDTKQDTRAVTDGPEPAVIYGDPVDGASALLIRTRYRIYAPVGVARAQCSGRWPRIGRTVAWQERS